MENNMNQKKAILAVSFGTSYADSRDADIGGIERALAAAFPAWEVRRAFTSGFIIKKIFRETGEKIDTVAEALERAEADGIGELLVQPTHFMKGIEYDEMQEVLEAYRDRFERLMIAEPLLSAEDDFRTVAEAIAAGTQEWLDKMSGDLPENRISKKSETAGVQSESSGGPAEDAGEPAAFILMGHGTSKAEANAVYEKMQQTFKDTGRANYYIATVEAAPTIEDVMEMIEEKGYRRIVLRPMMVVAGDHACNDMAGDDPDSWKSLLEKAGYEVTAVLHGLGEDPAIQEIYAAHARAALFA